MDQVREDSGSYLRYEAIPTGEEHSYEWISVKGGRGGHFNVPDAFYRRKTPAEITQDKLKISEMPAGTVIRDRLYLDTIPKTLHKYIDVYLQRRWGKDFTTKPSTEVLPMGEWVLIHYVRNEIPVEMAGGRRRATKKTRRNLRKSRKYSTRHN